MLLVGLMGEYVAPAAKRMADDIKAGAMSEGRLTVSAYGYGHEMATTSSTSTGCATMAP